MFIEETFRWYGPKDPVSLEFIRQTGATGIVSSLHHIPYGEVWSVDEIQRYQKHIADANLVWSVVESLPLHEDIKTASGSYLKYLDNYRKSLENLGKCGIRVITYNFMPVLDWVRTDLNYQLPDGSRALYFDHQQFAAFELFILQRPGAASEYTPEQLQNAENYYKSLNNEERAKLCNNIVDNFPGFKGMTIENVREMLKKYSAISQEQLRENLKIFLEAVIPTAENSNCVMAIHPDDPPWSILGLPRIFSNQSDIQKLLATVDSPANGICFCSGSFSARGDNNLIEMFKSAADRVAFLHLRSTAHEKNGNFYEANHLEGSVDMYGLMKAIIEEQIRRRNANRADWRLPLRPDHGHVMMDDLSKPPVPNPGYSAIGRMRGLAELRGLELGIMKSCFPEELKKGI